jgi:hypothetical protein
MNQSRKKRDKCCPVVEERICENWRVGNKSSLTCNVAMQQQGYDVLMESDVCIGRRELFPKSWNKEGQAISLRKK